VDADQDGCIAYDEVAVELAHDIVRKVKSSQSTSVSDWLGHIKERCAEADAHYRQQWMSVHSAATSSVEERGAEATELCPDIMVYLKDTFDQVDTDKSGALDSKEFWNILMSVLQLTEGDKSIIMVSAALYLIMSIYAPSFLVMQTCVYVVERMG
jgi:hypothetical protein